MPKTKTAVYLCVSTAIAAIALLLLLSCSGAQTPEVCFASKSAELNANRTATLVARCQEYPDIESCPYTAGIDEKFDRRIEAAKEACINGSP